MWDDGNDSFSSYEITEHKLLDGSETGSHRSENNGRRFIPIGRILLGLLVFLVGDTIVLVIIDTPNSTAELILGAALAILTLVGGVAIMIKKPKS